MGASGTLLHVYIRLLPRHLYQNEVIFITIRIMDTARSSTTHRLRAIGIPNVTMGLIPKVESVSGGK